MLVNVVQVEDLVLIRGLVLAWKVVDDNDEDDDVDVPFVFLSGTVMIKVKMKSRLFYQSFLRSGKA